MRAGASLHGTAELKAALRRVQQVGDAAIMSGLTAGGEVIRTETVANITAHGLVLSGDLRRSISVQQDRQAKAVDIGTSLVYAPVHEFGNAHHPARPYLRPAFDVKKNAALQRAATIAGDIITRTARR